MIAATMLFSALALNGWAAADVRTAVDWSQFLGRSDLVWSKLPSGWDDGAYLGNGLLGSIYWQAEDKYLHFEISRTDVFDHRVETGTLGRGRLPNGHFELRYVGANPVGDTRLVLWDAEAQSTIKTDRGTLRVRAFTHAEQPVIAIEVTATDGEANYAWSWHPDPSVSPVPTKPANYAPYPAQKIETVDGVTVSVQEMPESAAYRTEGRGAGQYATAWQAVEVGAGRRVYFISEGFSYPGTTAKAEAVAAVAAAVRAGLPALEASHRAWWHAFYPRSFLTVPDAKIESFYWIQMYKLASATRGDRPLVDLMGPWFNPSKWPGVWWNLNTQLTYAPFHVANHGDLAGSLLRTLDAGKETLRKNSGQYSDAYSIGRSSGLDMVRSTGTEAANLTYTLHTVWQQYRCTMDDTMLREKLYPLLRGNFIYYRHLLKDGPDGKTHLLPTGSPEYPGGDKVEDCSYTLSMLRWLAGAIVYANDRLRLDDPIRAECQQLLGKLAPYPVGANGILVGKDLPFAESHRHWSHFFMAYPLYEFTYDDPAQAALLDRTVQHWLSLPDAFRGFSRAAAVSLAAVKGDGAQALHWLNTFLDPKIRYAILPNTLYKEGGVVIETPLSGARSIQDMVLQAYNGMIRVFPGAPDEWADVAFDRFCADGGFLVSAQRQGGVTRFVRIESLAGEPCKVKTGLQGKVAALGSRTFQLTDHGSGVVQIDLKKGEWVVLHSGDVAPESLTIAPVAASGAPNYWGTKAP